MFIFYWFRKLLYKRREHYIQEWIDKFKTMYPNVDEDQIRELTKNMTDESFRIYAIVDYAILKANLGRGALIFWVILIGGILTCVLQNKLPPKHWEEFITPIILSFLSWIISCFTIPLLYIGRVEGAMYSEIIKYINRNNLEHLEI